MDRNLGLRAALAVVVLLAFVAATTSVIVAPALIGGPQAGAEGALHPAVAISHP